MNTNSKQAEAKIAKTAQRLLAYIAGHYKGLFAVSCVCILLSTAANVAGSMFLQVLVDQFIAPLLLTENPAFTGLLKMLALMATVYAIGVISSLIYNRLMVRISQGTLKTMRDEMFSHMQSLPIRYFDTHAHGDLMSLYTNDTDTLRQLISQALPQLFSCAITVIAVFCAMLSYSWQLALLVLCMSFVLLCVTRYVGGASTRYFVRQQDALGKINGYVEELLGGQKVVKVFCREARAEAEFSEKNDALFAASQQANRYSNILMPLLGQLGNLQYVLLALLGGWMALQGAGGITAGVIVAFLSLSKSFSMPIQQVSQQISMVSMALAGAQRIFGVIDAPAEIDDGYVTLVSVTETGGGLVETAAHTGLWAWRHLHHDKTITYTRLAGHVEMCNVDFGYEAGKIVLHDLTLSAEPGQKLAFVGATGAGKTTITNLLNRFYDIADGKIRYDGININKMKKDDLRRSLGIVLQDVSLFTATVMENIRYGRLDATDAACITAAKQTNAHDFISRLPQGYETVLTGAGEGLSQGQRQLLSIARAAVADPPAMILDEATSSIDTRTEKLVQQGMDSLMEGRTTFVIAHRLSTIRNADSIIVLDHGRAIERGSHTALIKKRGAYYQLATGVVELD